MINVPAENEILSILNGLEADLTLYPSFHKWANAAGALR